MIALDIFSTAVLALLQNPGTPAQQDDPQSGGLVAEFVLGGRTQTLSRNEVALYLSRRHRNSPGGKETVDHLIEVILVRQAAQAAGLMPTDAEVRGQIDRMSAELRRRKMDLEQILAKQRLSLKDLRENTALGMAQSRLAAKILNIPPEKVTAKHLSLWTQEQRNKVEIELDQSKLSPGVMARVGKDEVTNLDVGRVLFTKINADKLRESINRMVFERCIAYEAKRLHITLAPEELEHQYAQRKKAFESSDGNGGVVYEKWLEAFGSSKAQELKSVTMITTLLHDKLVRRRYPVETLNKRITEQRDLVMKHHGARRSVNVIFIRATDKPNKILRRDFPAALAHISEIRESIVVKNRPFAMMAKIASDDPNSKKTGGSLGWQHRVYAETSQDRRAPDEVLTAAFAMKIGEVSEPIRTDLGYFLVYVNGEEPEPELKTLHERLLGEMAERYNRELYEAAKIDIKIL